MESHAEVLEKLKMIFTNFLDKNFSSANNVYFEMLITHLSDKDNSYVLQEPFALEWVEECITVISEDFNRLHPRVISFMFQFCSLLTLNEWLVMKIRERKIMDKLIFIIDRDMQKFTPSMKLGSIRLLSAVSRYSLGLSYIRSMKAWRFLIIYCNKDHTLYVVREARQLLYDILYKFSVKAPDEHLCLEILNEIVRPLHENVFEERTDNMMISVDDSELQLKLSPTLELLAFIFKQTLESEEKTNIAELCRVHHNLAVTLWKLTEMTQNQYFLEKILATLSSFNFAQLVYEKWKSGQIAAEDFNQFGVTFFNLMKFCVSRRECVNFLKLAELNHVLWKRLGQRAPIEIHIEKEHVQFENQLITFHLVPVFFIMKSKEHHREELFDNYIMKIFRISCEHTMRICYAYRDILFSAQRSAVQLSANLACKSINGILSMASILDRGQAVLVFQAMVYALKEFNLRTVDESETVQAARDNRVTTRDLVVEIPNVLYAILIGLQTLIHRFKITWKESVETICVVKFVADLLENPNMSSRLVVQALKLTQLSIEHFLSPNMALLVDNLHGSALLRLGPIIVKRFHDLNWEVRDTALELVTSIACISQIKFPSFQQLIVDNDICPLVYQMAKNDNESYVRASAFKCLSKMISVNVIWEKSLSQVDLLDHLFRVVYNENEGIVRKEAVHALIKVYENRNISQEYKKLLYSSFCHLAVGDLYWEVKVAALQFWEVVIENQFTNQGMIDGTFPTVTFSKEKKKIVTLTEKEIKLRIEKIFNELSQRGCLGVILKCLTEDFDLEVIKTVIHLVQRLFTKLNKYDYETILSDMETVECSNDDNVGVEVAISDANARIDDPEDAINDSARSDAIIEGILSSQDINLLISVYEKQMQLNTDADTSTIDEHFYRNYTNINAKEFIMTVKNINLEEMLRNQYKWLSSVDSFASLLNDLLFTIKPEDAPVADCY